MNCDKDMISNLDAINNDDIVRKENGSSSRIDARNHIRSILKKRCLEWKKRSCPKLRNAELRKACLAKKKEIMRMRRQQYSLSLYTCLLVWRFQQTLNARQWYLLFFQTIRQNIMV